MALYRLSHFLGDGNKYYEHFIDTDHEHGQAWLDSHVEGAKQHHHPEYALKVEKFEKVEERVLRPN